MRYLMLMTRSRTAAQIEAERAYRAKHANVLVRLADDDLEAARALRAEGETLAGLFKRLLRERVE